MNGLSPVLKALLEQEPTHDRAVMQIAQTPALLEAAKAALPALAFSARCPADEGGVQRVIGKRFALFPQPERDGAEWDAWWSDYYAVLADVPESALEAGMGAWVAMPSSQFMPKPGELKELALKTENRAAKAYQRAKAAIEYQPPRHFDLMEPPVCTPRGIPEPSKGDKERVLRMAAEYAEKNRPLEKPDTRPMPIPATVDEKGVSAEMRSLMERRRSA